MAAKNTTAASESRCATAPPAAEQDARGEPGRRTRAGIRQREEGKGAPNASGGATDRVHLEVDQLSPGQRDDHLPLVDGAAHDGLLARGLPLVHALVRADVADPVRVHLRENGGGGEGSPEEPGGGDGNTRRARRGATCTRASSPSREQDRVGVVPRKPESVTSSTVSPMDSTRVALTKDTMM